MLPRQGKSSPSGGLAWACGMRALYHPRGDSANSQAVSDAIKVHMEAHRSCAALAAPWPTHEGLSLIL